MVGTPRIRTRGPTYSGETWIGEQYRVRKWYGYEVVDTPHNTFSDFSEARCTDSLNVYQDNKWVTGSYFDKDEQTVTVTPSSYVDRYISPHNGGWYWKYRGRYAVQPAAVHYYGSEFIDSGIDDLASYGAEAINRYRPGKPVHNFGVAIGELKDAPRLLYEKVRSLREVGSNYLKFQFGWKPFLNDLFAFFDQMQNFDKELDNFQKQFGKPVRRKGPLPETTSEFEYDVTAGASTRGAFGSSIQSKVVTDRVRQKATRWFSGSFTIPVPPDNRWLPLDAVTRQMYGVTLTPDNLYQLVPWTWLIDWIGNVGDNVANFSALACQNMSLNYAWIMGTYEVDVHRTCELDFLSYEPGTAYPVTPWSASCHSRTSNVRKLRVSPSPFSWRFTADELNAYKLSILAALGASRS